MMMTRTTQQQTPLLDGKHHRNWKLDRAAWQDARLVVRTRREQRGAAGPDPCALARPVTRDARDLQVVSVDK